MERLLILPSVYEFLNAMLPNCWTGRAEAVDKEWMKWLPRYYNLIPSDFYLRCYIKEKVFVTSTAGC
jgi:hypothetical protein